MKSRKNQVQSLNAYKRRQQLLSYAKAWKEALPNPSTAFPNLIFVYSEELATQNRELLFRKLDSAAAQNNQKLVISDCHYSRAGFYIVFDEIGGTSENQVDIDEIVERWREREN
jgi:hypothetical protein